MASEAYKAQVRLLVQVLEAFNGCDVFALKGGTAINLFLQNLPRLSVDIDLNFLPGLAYPQALPAIDEELSRIAQRILKISGVTRVERPGNDGLKRLVVARDARVKIEVNPVIRGIVYPATILPTQDKVSEAFGYTEMLVASSDDVYGGKLVAALDRQHPRDLFDVRLMLDSGLMSARLMKAFAVYLCSSNAPMSEVLNPRLKDLSGPYQGQFIGMVETEVSLERLIETRRELVELIHEKLGESERTFIRSVQRMEPDWNVLGIEGLTALPSVMFKVSNLGKMKPEAYRAETEALELILAKKGT
jgi:predicted nucleotidyltransferase component of viral defense system